MFWSDFMNTAEMAGREFDAEKWNVKLLDAQTRQVQLQVTCLWPDICWFDWPEFNGCLQVYIDTGGEEKAGPTAEQMKLRVPRRPSWQGLSPEQLKEVQFWSHWIWIKQQYSGGKQELSGLEKRAGPPPRGDWSCGDSLREELGVLEAVVESDRAEWCCHPDCRLSSSTAL